MTMPLHLQRSETPQSLQGARPNRRRLQLRLKRGDPLRQYSRVGCKSLESNLWSKSNDHNLANNIIEENKTRLMGYSSFVLAKISLLNKDHLMKQEV